MLVFKRRPPRMADRRSCEIRSKHCSTCGRHRQQSRKTVRGVQPDLATGADSVDAAGSRASDEERPCQRRGKTPDCRLLAFRVEKQRDYHSDSVAPDVARSEKSVSDDLHQRWCHEGAHVE